MKYTDFYSQLLMESIKIQFAKPFTEEQKQMAKKALKWSYTNEYPYYKNVESKMSSRYTIKLKDIEETYETDTFYFDMYEKIGRDVQLPSYEGSPRKQAHKIHRNIESAIKEIPHNKNSVYRGMSLEEALDIKNKGYIKSKGEMNIGASQQGYTFFGTTPSTARVYAGTFSPIPTRNTRNKPGVIIEIPKKLTISASTINPETNMPIGTDLEWVSNKPISINEITNVWLLVPSKSIISGFSIIFNKRYNKFMSGDSPTPNSTNILINKPDFFK